MEYIILELKNGEKLKVKKVSKSEVEVQLIANDSRNIQSVRISASAVAEILFS